MEGKLEILRIVRKTEVIRLRSAVVVAAAAMFVVGCSTTPAPEQVALAPVQTQLVGPQGYQGPAGPAGPQGPVGATGAPGYVMQGPAGAEGAPGPAGPQGPVGATGASGYLVSGARGTTGMAGPAGAQGAAGETGAQGSSAVGPAGPMGPAGPAGAQGAAGYEGARGPTLVGPIGPVGNSGVAGVQGVSGETGAQGYAMAGSAGAAGPSGDVGAQGPTGRTGAQGQAGIVGRWTAYRDFSFYGDQTDLQPSDVTMVNEIAGYMAQNPSLQIGIDGSTAPNGVAPTNQNLNDRRVDALHNALLTAGVPASKMQTGAFGDPQLRRDGRVEVLISTGSASTARSDD